MPTILSTARLTGTDQGDAPPGADLQLQIFKRPEVAKDLTSWSVLRRKA